MSVEAYDKGDRVRFSAIFRDLADVLTDPTAVKLRIRRPDASVSELTLAGGQVVRDSLGQFHADVDIDQSGAWAGKWEATGALVTAEEFNFIGKASNFP